MAKPIPFEIFNRLDSEAQSALYRLEFLLRSFWEGGNFTEDLCEIGISLCRDGRAQVEKVTEDWRKGEFDEKESATNVAEEITLQNDSESTGNKGIGPDYKPVEATPVVRFMENVDFRDIMDWRIYLERNGHDVARRPFSDIIDDAYRPEETRAQAERTV